MNSFIFVCILLALNALLAGGLYGASNSGIKVVEWINGSGQNVSNSIANNGIFVTNFKGTNDFSVQRLSGTVLQLWRNINFSWSGNGYNPSYIRNFIGSPEKDTGSGSLGNICLLNLGYGGSGSIQFDFATPLTEGDRILLCDVDGSERYQLCAYCISNGSDYVQLSTSLWGISRFSGCTGKMPDKSWPVWDTSSGIISSAMVTNLTAELTCLRPNNPIDRLVVYRLETTSITNWGAGILFVSGGVTNLSESAISPAIEISWNSVSQECYQVQWSTNLLNDEWLDIGDVVEGTGVTNSILDSIRNQPKKFYRVIVP